VSFKFKREATRSGSRVNALREYTYPDGKLAARERVIYEGDDLVSYAIEETQIGAAGAVRIQRDASSPAKSALLFEYAKDLASGSKPKTSTEALRNDTLTSDMVATFLLSHWAELSKGEKVKCRYLVCAAPGDGRVHVCKGIRNHLQGRGMVIIRMEATSLIIARLVDPVFFTLEKDGQHRVLEYTGRVTPKTKVGNKWDDLDATSCLTGPTR